MKFAFYLDSYSLNKIQIRNPNPESESGSES